MTSRHFVISSRMKLSGSGRSAFIVDSLGTQVTPQISFPPFIGIAVHAAWIIMLQPFRGLPGNIP